MKELVRKSKRAVALVMTLVLFMSLFSNIAFSRFEAESGESEKTATSTDAETVSTGTLKLSPVNADYTEFDIAAWDENTDLSGICYGVYDDESCIDETNEFVLSYSGRAYAGSDGQPVIYHRGDIIPAEEKKIELDEGTYFVKQKEYLYNSDVKVEDTRLARSTTVMEVTVAGDSEVKVILNIKPEEATPTDAAESRPESTENDKTESKPEGGSEETTEGAPTENDTTESAFAENTETEVSEATPTSATPTDAAENEIYVVTPRTFLAAAVANVFALAETKTVTVRNSGAQYAATHYYEVDGHPAVCSEHSKTGPSNGNVGTTYELTTENLKLLGIGTSDSNRQTIVNGARKAIAYSAIGPFSSKYKWNAGGLNNSYNINVLACTMDHYIARCNGGYDGAFDGYVNYAQSYVSFLNGKADIPSVADVTFDVLGSNKKSVKELKGTLNVEAKTITWGPVKLTKTVKSYTLPAGVDTLVSTDGKTYHKYAEGDYSKTKYVKFVKHLSDSDFKSQKAIDTSVTFKGRTGYNVGIVNFTKSTQKLGYYYGSDSMDRTIKLTYNYTPSYLTLEKITEGSRIAGAVYTVTRQKTTGGTRVHIAEFTTTTGGAKITKVYPGHIESDCNSVEDKALKGLLPGYRYYITETKAPKGYFLRSSKMASGISAETAVTVSESSVSYSYAVSGEHGIWDGGRKNSAGTYILHTYTTSDEEKKTYGSFLMRKVDAEDNEVYVAGAKYKLYSGKTLVATFETRSNQAAKITYVNTGSFPTLDTLSSEYERGGKKILIGLPEGTYTLKEVSAPDGYELSPYKNEIAVIKITDTKETVTYWSGKKVNGNVTWKSATLTSTHKDAYDYYTNGYLFGMEGKFANVYAATSDQKTLDPLRLTIKKVDADTGATYNPEKAGGTTPSLEGAVFEIKYTEDNTTDIKTWHIQTLKKESDGSYWAELDTKHLVSYPGDSEPPEVTDGAFRLPPGTVTITEVDPPEGYLNVGGENRGSIKITQNNKPVYIDDSPSVTLKLDSYGNVLYFNNVLDNKQITIYEQVQRGDVEFNKTYIDSDGNVRPMAGVVFKITEDATGEAHYVVTDKDGSVNTRTLVNKNHTNENDAAYENKTALNSDYGVWFLGDASGEFDESKISDNMGALRYGDYTIEEVRCEANKGYVLSSPKTITLTKDGQLVSLTGKDGFTNVPYPSLTTEADHFVKVGDAVTVKDAVSFKFLKADTTYTVKGVVMDKETGLPAKDGSGKFITAVKSFKTGTEDAVSGYLPSFTLSGDNAVNFVLNTNGMESEYVVFEYLYEGKNETPLTINDGGADLSGAMKDDEGNVIAHADIEDGEGAQTFTIPKITTEAFIDEEGKNHIQARKDTVIIDKINYTGLTPGETYRVVTKLVFADGDGSKTAGDILYTESDRFTADKANGTTSVTYRLDATPYDGYTIVLYEYVYDMDGNEIAKEEDITNEAQTIEFVHFHTNSNSDKTPSDYLKKYDRDVTIVDKVTATNLVIGKEYTVSGVLMDKNTGKEVKRSDGSLVTGSTTFTAEKENYTDTPIEVVFTFNPKDCNLLGHKTVVFEKLDGDYEVAVHEDLTDEKQENGYPEIKTKLARTRDGEKMVSDKEPLELTDKVSYKNLVPDNEYILVGKLYNKRTGEQLTVDGKAVEKTVKFIAEENGDTDVTFDPIDIEKAGLKVSDGKMDDIVCFEYLYYGSVTDENLLADHEDITCKDQTVQITTLKTTATGEEGEKFIDPDKDVTIYDKVEYTNLIIGKTYTVKGTLMNAETGKAVVDSRTGKEITGKTTFTADKADGYVTVEFTFNPVRCGVAGTRTVVFEDLYHKEHKINSHSDITDKDQTTYYPTVGTSFANLETGTDRYFPDAKTLSLADTVTYSGVKPDNDYKLVAYIMVKDTGKFVRNDGKQYKEEVTFHVGSTTKGKQVVKFNFNVKDSGIINDGKSSEIVCFEYLYDMTTGEQIADHADISYTEQTISPVPEGHTTAEDKASGTQSADAAGKATIVDHVYYNGLIVGKTYTLHGTLMRKSTGKPLGVDGSENTITFVPKTSDGCVDIEFTFDASVLKGEKIVVFEDCYDDKDTVFTYNDINDTEEIISFPEISTVAATRSGGKRLTGGALNTVTDKVSYKDLDSKYEYTIKGRVIEKSTGNTVAETEKKFKPEEAERFASGTVSLDFTFDVPVGNEEYVVYESVYAPNGELITSEEDITNKDQTVYVTTNPDTGDRKPLMPFILIFGLALTGITFIIATKHRRKK